MTVSKGLFGGSFKITSESPVQVDNLQGKNALKRSLGDSPFLKHNGSSRLVTVSNHCSSGP